MRAARFPITLSAVAACAILRAMPTGAQIIDHSKPSTMNDDLVAHQNYSWGPIFVGGLCRLTDKGQSEISSVYNHQRLNVTKFQNSFVFQIVAGGPEETADGTGNVADGLTFIIQNHGLDALGGGGGAAAVQKQRINIPVVVGGKTAVVGFTAATGPETAAQDILRWYFASESLADPRPDGSSVFR